MIFELLPSEDGVLWRSRVTLLASNLRGTKDGGEPVLPSGVEFEENEGGGTISLQALNSR